MANSAIRLDNPLTDIFQLVITLYTWIILALCYCKIKRIMIQYAFVSEMTYKQL